MFAGSLVAIVTPMRVDGSIDLEAWARLLDFHVANGSDGIVVGGTTGESATLRDEELRALLLRACERLRGQLAVIAGAGTSSTAITVERVGWLSELPIDGLLLVTPSYNRPTQEGLYQHFVAAAAAARKPLLLYNVPARTAIDMQPATVARLARPHRRHQGGGCGKRTCARVDRRVSARVRGAERR
jgi:4-hydroxy-tetrahydrodipicolinate synthase